MKITDDGIDNSTNFIQLWITELPIQFTDDWIDILLRFWHPSNECHKIDRMDAIPLICFYLKWDNDWEYYC